MSTILDSSIISKFLNFRRVKDFEDENADTANPESPGLSSAAHQPIPPYTDFSNHICSASRHRRGISSSMLHRQGSRSRSRSVTPEPPDERSRLLSPTRRYARREYLDPDDPAVSPYNLWTVRGLRWFTIVFFSLSVIWWILLLVSAFVSPPGMQSRGSGFYDFSFASIAVAVLLITLLFFATPCRAEQYTLALISGLLLVDTIIIVSVNRIHVEAGWVGITTVLWAALVSAWAVLCDRIVEYGKQEEEERLTGRVENKRTLGEWFVVFASTVLSIALVVVAFLLTMTLILRAHDASLTAPGKKYFVDNDKYQVHVFCKGSKNMEPAIMLEGGGSPVESTLMPWIDELYQSGRIGRYCYWDRPGIAFSDNAPSPLSASMAVDALSQALTRGGEQGSWILVSHGIGGIYSRIFASRHAAEVKGLLLIDSLHESLLPRIASAKRGFWLWIRGVMSPLGFERLAGWIFQRRTREDRVFGKVAYQDPKFIKAKLQENLVATTFTKNEIDAARAILPRDIPIAVVSSEKVIKNDVEWYEAQKQLSELSDKLIAWDIVDAPHEVWETADGKAVLEDRLRGLERSQVPLN